MKFFDTFYDISPGNRYKVPLSRDDFKDLIAKVLDLNHSSVEYGYNPESFKCQFRNTQGELCQLTVMADRHDYQTGKKIREASTLEYDETTHSYKCIIPKSTPILAEFSSFDDSILDYY